MSYKIFDGAVEVFLLYGFLLLVYVIGWGAVVFGINCTSNVGKKL